MSSQVTADNPAIDFSAIQTLGNRIIGQVNALREIAPICWSASENSWIVSGHAEVTEAFSGRLPLSAERFRLLFAIVPDEDERKRLIPNMLKYNARGLVNLDPPEHTRVRKLMMKAFSRTIAEDYRPEARNVIRRVLDSIKGRTEVEFVEEVARQITARNLLQITGLRNEELYLPQLKRWSYLQNAGLSGRPTKELVGLADKTFAEMADAFRPEIERKRKDPTDDFVSMLVKAREDDDFFTDDEIISQLALVMIAGHDTTLNTMALSVNALAQDRNACDFMRNNPDAMLNSVMELMRYVAMSTEQLRVVAEDFTWKGHSLRKGQLVHLMIVGANRDPRVFTEPERLDLNRPQHSNVTFGPGLHHCIGHFFAKMQLTEFFPEFLNRYDFDVMDKEIEFGGGLTFRGPQAMHVRLRPRQ